jgi:hypothetical protein
MRNIDRRLAAAEQTAKSKVRKFQIFRVTGGLPGPIRCARAGALHWERLPAESMESFEERIVEAAVSAKSKTVVIGGLCPCAWRTPESFEAYLNGPDFQLPDQA